MYVVAFMFQLFNVCCMYNFLGLITAYLSVAPVRSARDSTSHIIEIVQISSCTSYTFFIVSGNQREFETS
jgi:hypothetical protein